MSAQAFYHVIPLSNFARGYDKYRRCYDKANVPESTYPDRFFVLSESEIAIGIQKVASTLAKLNLEGNDFLVLQANLNPAELHQNEKTGKGRFKWGSELPISQLWRWDGNKLGSVIAIEDAYAASLKVLHPVLNSFNQLAPRTLSVLPIARACQAKCQFCYSESSVSAEQSPRKHLIPNEVLAGFCDKAKALGASRFVITGGGEPGLVPHPQLVDLIHEGARHFAKIVLITNGVHLSSLTEARRLSAIRDYRQGGLSTLAVSRHHYDPVENEVIMGLDTKTERIFETMDLLKEENKTLTLRLICVLQKGGIDSSKKMQSYLDWATNAGVHEICFKELYVASSLESIYHTGREHQWCQEHQVPLSLVTEFCIAAGFAIKSRLPWGAPVFEGIWNNRPVRIAAYTEPNVFWERKTGIARSWNLMADGTCLASLEDPSSSISLRTTYPRFNLKKVS